MKKILFLLFFIQNAFAAEIDSYTPRYLNFPEGLPVINQEVNRRIINGVERANSITECNDLALKSFLALELLRPMYGQIEQFVNNSMSVPKENVMFAKSIYQNIPEPHAFLFSVGEFLFPFGNVVREGRWLIGSDKFGHFMDEGYQFYLQLNQDRSNLDEILKRSIWTEDTYNGLTFGGIKSYGDLVANYQGMRFWSKLVGPKFPDDQPYLKCENKKWVILRPFDFREYVDAGWDEAINCSEYKSVEFAQSVESAIKKLQTTKEQYYSCPIFPEDCVSLVKKYQTLSSMLIHPKCLAAK